MFNIISRRSLLEYCRSYPKAATLLQDWYHECERMQASNFNELKRLFPAASIVGDDRVVFNIRGNHFRLVARIVFEFKVIQIKWFGTHAEYDLINASTVNPKK